MRTKAVLLQSVSAIAAAAASTANAYAQVLPLEGNGYFYQVGGGALFSPAEMSLAGLEEDKMGYGFQTELDDFDKHLGYNAFFSVGKQIDNTWDVRFGGSINKLLDSTATLNFSSGFFSAGVSGYGYSSATQAGISGSFTERESFGFGALDFEVGYTPILDETNSVRLFAGIRGLAFVRDAERTGTIQFESSFSYSSYSSSFSSSFSYGSSFNQTLKSTFIGAGPRGGISAAHRFEGTNFGISGTVAGALLLGRQTNEFTFTDTIFSTSSFSSTYTNYGGYTYSAGSSFSSSFTTYSGSSSRTENKMVVDLEAKLGLDFYLTDNSALTIGYRAEKLLNVGIGNDWEDSKLVHGPFVSLTGTLP